MQWHFIIIFNNNNNLKTQRAFFTKHSLIYILIWSVDQNYDSLLVNFRGIPRTIAILFRHIVAHDNSKFYAAHDTGLTQKKSKPLQAVGLIRRAHSNVLADDATVTKLFET